MNAVWLTCSSLVTGLLTSIDGIAILRFVAASKTVRKRLRSIFLLNGMLVVVAALERAGVRDKVANAVYYLLCGGDAVATVRGPQLSSAVLTLFGVLPLVLASLTLSTLWTTTLVTRAHALTMKVRPASVRAVSTGASESDGVLHQLAEGVYRALLLLTANVLVLLLSVVPVVGRAAAVIVSALLASFVAHDALWSLQSPAPSAAQRLDAAARSWPFFIGHGLLTAALSFTPWPLVNVASYALLSPLLVLQALARDAPPAAAGFALPLLAPAKALVTFALRAAMWLLSRAR